MSSRHDGVTCDGCSKREFRLRRYKCLVCRDYDLCGSCFDSEQVTNSHSSSHPMQCLIPKADHKLFYQGETPSDYSVHSFTCPLCGQLGFTETSFSVHVFQKHPRQEAGDAEVICPLCATHSEGDHNRQIRGMAQHLKTTHHLSVPNCDKNGTQLIDPPHIDDEPERNGDSTEPRYSSGRRLLSCFLPRPHRTTEVSRAARGFGFTRSGGRSQQIMDLSGGGGGGGGASGRDYPSYETVFDLLNNTGRSDRPPSQSVSNAGSFIVSRRGASGRRAFLTGRNAHNEDNRVGDGSGVSISPAASIPRLVESSISVEQHGTAVNNQGTLVLEIDQPSESDRLTRGIEASVATMSSDHEAAVSPLPTTIHSLQPVNNVQRSARATVQGLSTQQSLSGDTCARKTTVDEVVGDKNGKTVKKDPLPVGSVCEPKRIVKDELDEHWVAFLQELVWSSLYFPRTNDEGDERVPTG